VILLLLGLLAIQQPAQPMSIRGEGSGADFQLVLAWTTPVEFTTTSNTRELTLRFNKPVGTPELEQLSRQFPLWLEGVSAGYDSLLIRSAQEVNYTVERRTTDIGNDIQIRLTLRGVAPVSEATEKKADFRLEILRAQLLSRGGQDQEALALLDRLAAEYPDETLVFLNRGEIQLRRNRWREATGAYKQALAVDPGNDDARDALDFPLLANQRSTFKMEGTRRSVSGGQTELIEQLSGHLLLRDAVRLGFSASRNDLRFNGSHTRAYRGEVYSQFDFKSGALVRGGYLAGQNTHGGMVQIDVPGGRGLLHVQADYQRPFWEFVEGVGNDGTRDRVEVRRQQELARGLAVRGTASANRYGLGTQKNSATSLAYDAGVVKTFGSVRIIGFEYLFDAEYRKTHRNPALPLVSREVHGADVFVDIDFRRKFRIEGFGGYTVDQKGGEGPFYGGRATFHVGWFEAQAVLDRRLNSVATGQVVTRFDAYMLWRF
jgi:hypothetical protein